MAKNPFDQLDVIRKASQKGKLITDCYRLMYKKELWYKAYNNVYLHKKRSDIKSDHVSLQKIDYLIEQLKAGTFRFTPIEKKFHNLKSNHQRKCKASNSNDKLILEVMSMILNNVYEPIFCESFHGLEKNPNYHTVLSQVKYTWEEPTWCIHGNINICFDYINHSLLIKLIAKKINDHRFLLLFHNMLSSGILKNPSFVTKHQDIFSSLLIHIILHEFDMLINNQTKGLIVSGGYKRLKYARLSSDFIIGVSGPKQLALYTKELINVFLRKNLQLPSHEKISISHMKDPIYFLGYEFKRKNDSERNESFYKNKKCSIRETIKLEVSKRKLKELASKNGYGNLESHKSSPRPKLINKSELKILSVYNSELTEIANYYKLANNYHHLNKLFYIAKSSFIKTIAIKRKSTYKKVASSMRSYPYGAQCFINKDNPRKYQFVKLNDLPRHVGPFNID